VQLLDLLTADPLADASCQVDILNDWVRTLQRARLFRRGSLAEMITPGCRSKCSWRRSNPENYRQIARQNSHGPPLILLEFDGMTEALFQRFREEGFVARLRHFSGKRNARPAGELLRPEFTGGLTPSTPA
jgi:hypothetical protein